MLSIFSWTRLFIVTNRDLHYQRLWKDRKGQVRIFYLCQKICIDLLCDIYQCLFCGAVIAIGILTFIKFLFSKYSVNWVEMTFANIFDRIRSKLIGLKFVGSSISPDLWISIIIECFHGLGNTFVTIDVLIINLIYGIATIRLSLMCWRLIWSCPVDLVFLSFDIADADCTGWGLHNEDFLVIRGCVPSCLACTSTPLVWCLCFTSLHVFSPALAKKVVEGGYTNGGVLEIAFVLLWFALELFAIAGSRCR